MTRNDNGHPESEKDLEQIRAKNNQRRAVNPEEPGTIGDSHHGVLSDREPGRDDNTKAGSGTKGSHPKR